MDGWNGGSNGRVAAFIHERIKQGVLDMAYDGKGRVSVSHEEAEISVHTRSSYI
jgi:hypothetical protein